MFDDLGQLEDLLDDKGDDDLRPAFVLNDEEITFELLDRKFKGRKVEADLAASMWYDGAI